MERRDPVRSSYFTTPAGHAGVTFLAATGDSGCTAGYPAYSPNVVAVGGTQLTLNNNAYGSETGWNFPTPRTLDNGDSSYSQSGSWSSQSGGFSGAYSSAAGGQRRFGDLDDRHFLVRRGRRRWRRGLGNLGGRRRQRDQRHLRDL